MNNSILYCCKTVFHILTLKYTHTHTSSRSRTRNAQKEKQMSNINSYQKRLIDHAKERLDTKTSGGHKMLAKYIACRETYYNFFSGGHSEMAATLNSESINSINKLRGYGPQK